MIHKIKSFIKQNNLIQNGDVVVVGVSGGADSVALLHILFMLKREMDMDLYVVHINHGIRKEASDDADYVEKLCKTWGLPFYLFCEDVPLLAKKNGKSEEEMGREYRYQCFDRVAKQICANKIAVAHHENDQVETILFHLIRGTDLQGLVGMQPITMRQNNPQIIRPLLCVNRLEIEAYLNNHNILWKEDITNQDTVYARNALRNIVIPALEDINEQAVSHIARLGSQVTQYERYLDTQVQEYINKNVDISETQVSVNRQSLLEMDSVITGRILYELLGRICDGKRDIGHEHIAAVYELLHNQSGKKLTLPHGVIAGVVYEKLILRKSLQEEEISRDDVWIYIDNVVWIDSLTYETVLENGDHIKLECKRYEDLVNQIGGSRTDIRINLKNNYTKYFDCDTIKGKLCVRTSSSMDYFCMNESGNRKKLSRYFKDEKIPVNIRNTIPVLATDREVLYIFGYRRCEKYKVTENTEHVLIVSYEGEENGSY